MKAADREALDAFCDESAERLDRIAAGLARLAGSGAADAELLHAVFRDTHSLKGGANLLNLAPVERLCHKLEDILAGIRDGSDRPDEELIEILSAGYSRIEALLKNMHLLSFVDVSRDIADIDCRLAARCSPGVKQEP